LILLLATSKVLYDTISSHPFQNVYFNEATINRRGEYFDLDYYGLSFKQGLEKLLIIDDDPLIKVAYSDFSGINNEYILPYYQRKRFAKSSIDSADYFITNYHINLQTKEQILNNEFPYNQSLIYIHTSFNNSILGIYHLNSKKRKEVLLCIV
jgi:hypothetical protein